MEIQTNTFRVTDGERLGHVNSLTLGQDGNLWMAEARPTGDLVWRYEVDANVLTAFPLGVNVNPRDIEAGPDGAPWQPAGLQVSHSGRLVDHLGVLGLEVEQIRLVRAGVAVADGVPVDEGHEPVLARIPCGCPERRSWPPAATGLQPMCKVH